MDQDSVEYYLGCAIRSLGEGAQPEEISREFVDLGIPQQLSAQIVARAQELRTEAIRQANRRAGWQTAAKGAGLATLGGVVTLWSYSAAEAGGSYVVTTGLLAVGVVYTVAGLYRGVFG
jgi:hypothetical protein